MYKNGGLSGRFCKKTDEFNSKGEALNYWDACRDSFTDRDGNTAESGDRIHVIAKAQADGHHKLTYYQQLIITAE